MTPLHRRSPQQLLAELRHQLEDPGRCRHAGAPSRLSGSFAPARTSPCAAASGAEGLAIQQQLRTLAVQLVRRANSFGFEINRVLMRRQQRGQLRLELRMASSPFEHEIDERLLGAIEQAPGTLQRQHRVSKVGGSGSDTMAATRELLGHARLVGRHVIAVV